MKKIPVSLVLLLLIGTCQPKKNIQYIKYNMVVQQKRKSPEYFVWLDQLNQKGNILKRSYFRPAKNFKLDSSSFEVETSLVREKGYQIVSWYKLPIEKSDSCEIIDEDYKVCYMKDQVNLFIRNCLKLIPLGDKRKYGGIFGT